MSERSAARIDANSQTVLFGKFNYTDLNNHQLAEKLQTSANDESNSSSMVKNAGPQTKNNSNQGPRHK